MYIRDALKFPVQQFLKTDFVQLKKKVFCSKFNLFLSYQVKFSLSIPWSASDNNTFFCYKSQTVSPSCSLSNFTKGFYLLY